jgi:anion-transporting  ArsA/GET3 family ATPase
MRLLIFSAHNRLLQSAAAIATAAHAARRGARVLLASVGPSHITGALLGQALGPRPLELEPNLAAIEVSPLDEIGQRWEAVRPTLRGGLVGRIRDLGADELPAFPGMDAVAALLVAERARDTGRFDLVVADGPAPEELARSLTLPDATRWVVRLIFGLDRGPGRSRSSLETAIIPSAILAPSATGPLQDLRVVLEEQRSRLDAATGTRVRLVATPEELHLPAIRQSLQSFGLYGLASDELVVAGELTEVDDPPRHEFAPETGRFRPTLRVGPLPATPTDRDGWALRGAALYRDGDIYNPAAPARPPTGEREARLYIPFLDPKSLDIALASEEVVVRLGSQRRHLLLPGITEGGRLRAKVEGELLRLWVE